MIAESDVTNVPSPRLHAASVFGVAASIVLGLAFVWIRSPLPWGWEGFDQYHTRALALAHGGGIRTTDVPWGYTIFLACFYRVFGDHPGVPLTAQAVLNGAIPLLVYRLVAQEIDRRAAAIAAVLIGLFSFNTLYASTQSSDAVCNVCFVAGMTVYACGRRAGNWRSTVAAGLLLGVASQFRPNLLLFPIALTGVESALDRRRWRPAAVLLACALAVDAPWTLYTYRTTGEAIPTSTHGGITLWFGTLEVGPYLHNYAYNPRHMFERTPFTYTSIAGRSIELTGELTHCSVDRLEQVDAVFWTDRDPRPQRAANTGTGDDFRAEIPAQPDGSTVYYRVFGRDTGKPLEPKLEGDAPFVLFVTRDHLGDPDRRGELLDVFDVARLLNHVVWGDSVSFADKLDADGDGRLTERDLRAAANALLWSESTTWTGVWVPPADSVVAAARRVGNGSALTFGDGSTLTAPRGFTRITDLAATEGLARTLFFRTRPLAAAIHESWPPADVSTCPSVALDPPNTVFYRREPHDMHRYSALALDNIRRSPWTFGLASLYRAFRVFVVTGSTDVGTAVRFERATLVYAAGLIVSLVYLALFLAGMVVCAVRGRLSWVLLVPIVYVPVTIAPLFANMRYSITVQPFMFAFIGVALGSAYDWWRAHRSRPPAADHAS